MSENTQQIKAQRDASWRRWITSLILLGLLVVLGIAVVGGWDRFVRKAQIVTQAGPDTAHTAPADAIRAQQIVHDDVTAVDAGGWVSYSFRLPGPRPVKIEVTGLRDTAKGFGVYLADADQRENIQAGKRFEYFQDKYHGYPVRSISETHRLPAGHYILIVKNSQNLLNSMEVSVRVIADPEN